jgi:carboxypeptidase Taq
MKAYQQLEARFSRTAAVQDAVGILQWDTETMMPEGANDGRSDQLAVLKGLAHEILTAPITRDLLEQAKDEDLPSEWHKANL